MNLGYEVKTEWLAIERSQSLHIRSLKDRQQFCDPLGEAARLGISSAVWPHFGQVWPAGLILAEHVASLDIAGRRVLELGCGLGLASLVMHRAGADVTASDVHPLAGIFLAHNLRLNQLGPMSFRRGDWGDVDSTLGRFGLLVGSDLLYERTHATDLSAFVDRHAAPIAEVIIVDPNRGHRAAFRGFMADLDFTMSAFIVAPQRPDGSTFRGQILAFSRG